MDNFRLFGPTHLAILAAVAFLSALLSWRARRSLAFARAVRLVLGGLLLLNEIAWWVFRYSREGLHAGNLPLQLCDFTLWLTIAALLTLSPWACEVAYYAGLAGTLMALLTPDLWAPWPSYPAIYFFLEHGGVVVAILMLACGGIARPRPSSVARAFLILNAYAAAVGTFNAVFATNYMYLRHKPVNPSLLDYFGPWPLYLLPGELLALGLFYALWLPFRARHTSPHSAAAHSRSVRGSGTGFPNT